MASAILPTTSHGIEKAPAATVGARVLALVGEFPGIKRDAVNKAIAGASGAVRAFLIGGRLTELNDRLFLPTHDPQNLTELRSPRELVLDIVTRNPGTSRGALHDLTAEGTRVANLLVLEGRLVRRGQNFYLPQDAPPLNEGTAPDPTHDVAVTIRTSPGLTLSALRERHQTISDINAVLRILCHRHVARRADSPEGYRWYPIHPSESRTDPREVPGPGSPAPITVTPPAIPEAGPAETDLMPEATPMTTTQETPERTTRTKSTPPTPGSFSGPPQRGPRRREPAPRGNHDHEARRGARPHDGQRLTPPHERPEDPPQGDARELRLLPAAQGARRHAAAAPAAREAGQAAAARETQEGARSRPAEAHPRPGVVRARDPARARSQPPRAPGARGPTQGRAPECRREPRAPRPREDL